MILYIPKDDDEYVILPISSMLNKSHMDFYFDVFLNISAYPKLKLKKDSYIRTSKQTIAYKWDIDFKHCLGDLRNDYSKLYEYILYKVRMFDTKKIENSR